MEGKTDDKEGVSMEGSKLAAAILGEVRRAVVGKDEVLAKVLLAILAGGHILLEDIPGVGKTTMALAFSKALSLRYNRVQFTPDVMPSDITGFTLYNKEAGRMEYQPGAVLCNLFLADELNRATSRTQSALLEAMEEGQVTVDGVAHPVPQPFLVIATQNPVSYTHLDVYKRQIYSFPEGCAPGQIRMVRQVWKFSSSCFRVSSSTSPRAPEKRLGRAGPSPTHRFHSSTVSPGRRCFAR